MSTFRLTFEDDDIGTEKYVEFESENPASILSHLKREMRGRNVRVSRDGQNLATVTRCNRTGDFWIVNPRPDLPEGE